MAGASGLLFFISAFVIFGRLLSLPREFAVLKNFVLLRQHCFGSRQAHLKPQGSHNSQQLSYAHEAEERNK
jgi:hypothetical protein